MKAAIFLSLLLLLSRGNRAIDSSNDNFTLINESPLPIDANFSGHVPAIVLFENFIFQAVNLSDTDLRTFDGNASVKTVVSYATRFIQENLENLYRNLNALNRFVTRNKYAETKHE